MDDEAKYACVLQYFGKMPTPTHYKSDESGNFIIIYDQNLVSLIAHIFGRNTEQVQQDIRNYATVAKRLGVLPTDFEWTP